MQNQKGVRANQQQGHNQKQGVNQQGGAGQKTDKNIAPSKKNFQNDAEASSADNTVSSNADKKISRDRR